MEFDWEIRKAEPNFKNSVCASPRVCLCFEDDYAIDGTDQNVDIAIGNGMEFDCRKRKPMKRQYDFSKGKRGRILPVETEQRARRALPSALMKIWWITF